MHQSVLGISKFIIAFMTVVWSSTTPASANDGYDFTLKKGALIVTAITRSHQESDFQSYKRILKAHPDRQIQYSSDVTSGYWNLTISENAVAEAGRYWPYFLNNTTYQSSTALSVSRGIWDKINDAGSADFTLYIAENEELFCNGQLRRRDKGVLELIFDDVVQPIPVIYADLQGTASEKEIGATLGDCNASLAILDNRSNPVILRLEANSAGRHEPSSLSVTVVRIESGGPIKERLLDALSKGERAPLYGIHFDFGEATIRPDSAPVLEAIAELLQENPRLALSLEGHTDWIGDDAWNQDLSERRALAVMSNLVQSFGVDAARLDAVGFGKSRPIAGSDQTTLVGRAINRRVEVVAIQ
ncbi:MAG: OmpA family protein [Pseudomonadota bacterium]